MLNYNWFILGDIFRTLNGHLQANLEQCFFLDAGLLARS